MNVILLVRSPTSNIPVVPASAMSEEIGKTTTEPCLLSGIAKLPARWLGTTAGRVFKAANGHNSQ